MTSASWALLAIAACAASADWIAVAARRKGPEYVLKPLTLVLLIGVALALEPVSSTQRSLVVVALTLSLAGDVFLMLPSDRFLGGLAAFFGAHVAYIAAFITAGLVPAAVGAGVVLAGALGASIAVAILSSVEHRRLRAAVGAYMVAIFGMLVTAIGTANPLAATGAAIFVASDTVLGWNRFVADLPWAPVVIMVTYHLGQGLIVVSLTL